MKRKSSDSPAQAMTISLLIWELAFAAVFWGVVFLLDRYANGFISDYLYDILGSSLYNRILGYGASARPLLFMYAVILYIVIAVLIGYIQIRRMTAGYIKLISDTVKTMMNQSGEIRSFPKSLKDVEVSLKNIRYTVRRNEQLAREAEQRKNDLVVYLAHDLKTPLTSVIGYLSMLHEVPDLPLVQREKCASIALDKAYRLEQLIDEFFDITRFNLQSVSLERNRIDLSVMLRQTVDEFYPILEEKNLALSENIKSGIQIIGDANKLERTFDNVIRNAISYSNPDTCITISAKTADENVIIAVRNSGDEIPPEKISRIFEKFFRVDSARGSRTGGAGLGLAISKQIVELHGGTIAAVSNPDFTELTITLPMKT